MDSVNSEPWKPSSSPPNYPATVERDTKPAIVKATAAVVGVPAGLAVLTGAFWLMRKALGGPVPMIGGGEGVFVVMILLSLVVAIVLVVGLGAMWERGYGGRRTVILAGLFGLATSVAAQLAYGTEYIAIGVSWIATGVSALLLLVPLLPQVRAYFDWESQGDASLTGRSRRPFEWHFVRHEPVNSALACGRR